MTSDHGYCKSLYITDPNGLLLEFTVDHPEVDEIDAIRGIRTVISLGGYRVTTRATTHGAPMLKEGRTTSSPSLSDDRPNGHNGRCGCLPTGDRLLAARMHLLLETPLQVEAGRCAGR